MRKIRSVVWSVLVLVAMLAALTVPALAASKPALSKDDFSFGGKTVKGYTNFIDYCEATGNQNPYQFTNESKACQNANRGINIGDPANVIQDKVQAKYGTPSKITEGAEGPDYVYQFSYHGKTYRKIFHTVVQHAEQENWVYAIEYQVK